MSLPQERSGDIMINSGQRGIAILVLMVMVFAVPEGAFANSSGKTGSSSSGCGGCHGGGNTMTPTLTTDIPSSGYTPGAVYSLTIGGTGGVSGCLLYTSPSQRD